ncbi:MAG: hypothetical protein QM728_02940 [Gordonia sp. (in: high G+C Gram-positive bacteria)]|uniref:hypothetical protein n=1 Tax=Gordonia sp. (in: high G+C Gram-positive bacteria) TaxID=84139 RepID=UPI0039E5B16E
MRTSILGITAAAALIGGLTTLASAGEADASWRHVGNGDKVTFEVFSDTTWATVSYYNRNNHLVQKHFNFRQDERLPDGRYFRIYAFRSRVPQQIVAVRIKQEGLRASCRLSVNGRLKAKHTGYGERASATCAVRNDAPPFHFS